MTRGMEADRLRDFQRFLAKLKLAVEAQAAEANAARRLGPNSTNVGANCVSVNRHWTHCCTRHARAEAIARPRREQKEQDEFALRTRKENLTRAGRVDRRARHLIYYGCPVVCPGAAFLPWHGACKRMAPTDPGTCPAMPAAIPLDVPSSLSQTAVAKAAKASAVDVLAAPNGQIGAAPVDFEQVLAAQLSGPGKVPDNVLDLNATGTPEATPNKAKQGADDPQDGGVAPGDPALVAAVPAFTLGGRGALDPLIGSSELDDSVPPCRSPRCRAVQPATAAETCSKALV